MQSKNHLNGNLKRKIRTLIKNGINIGNCGCSKFEIIDYLKNNKCDKKFLELIKHEDESFNLLNRLNEINRLGRDSSSLESLVLRYGKKEGNKRFRDKCKKTKHNKSDYIKKFGKEKFLFDRGSNNHQNRIIRYGNKANEVKNQYLEKWKKSHSLNGYIEKYGKEKGTKFYNEKIKRYQKTNSLDGYIEKYGKEKGTRIFNEKIKKAGYKQSKNYYINLYGEEMGLKILRDLKDNNSLESFINRLGNIQGIIEYLNYCKKVKQIAIDNEFYKNFDCNWQSKKANNFFDELVDIINKQNINKDNRNIYYKDNEYSIYSEDYKTVFFYDFKLANKIIEFNGDFWHANPNKFNSKNKHPLLNIKNEEITKKDMKKNQLVYDRGFDLLVIWESELDENRKEVLDRCINFLKQ